MTVQALRWMENRLEIIDQTLLPGNFEYITLHTVSEVWEAIKILRVRGAPAIGICAGYGILVALRETPPQTTPQAIAIVRKSAEYLATSRPTAVNLFWALDRMRNTAESCADLLLSQFIDRMDAEAAAIYREETSACRAIGEHGAALIPENGGVLTHCNAGALATGEYGTALAPMYHAHAAGKRFHVFADETRPLLQGARLTAWELTQSGIDTTLLCDNMAAQVMREGRIDLVITGADRIAANGDTANKIGTYGVALLAQAHRIPFYIAAPASTFDFELPDGSGIPIEQRDPAEVTRGFGKATAPDNVRVYNPAFDVTPENLIAGIITEFGILRPPFKAGIEKLQMGMAPRKSSLHARKPD